MAHTVKIALYIHVYYPFTNQLKLKCFQNRRTKNNFLYLINITYIINLKCKSNNFNGSKRGLELVAHICLYNQLQTPADPERINIPIYYFQRILPK